MKHELIHYSTLSLWRIRKHRHRNTTDRRSRKRQRQQAAAAAWPPRFNAAAKSADRWQASDDGRL